MKITPPTLCPHPRRGNDPKAPQPAAPSCYTLTFIAHTDPFGAARGGCATLSHFRVGFWAPSLSSVQGGLGRRCSTGLKQRTQHPASGVHHIQAGDLIRSRNEAPQRQQHGPTAPRGRRGAGPGAVPGHRRASEERGHLAGVVGQDADGVLGPAAQQAQHGVLLQRDTAAGLSGCSVPPRLLQHRWGNPSRGRHLIPACNRTAADCVSSPPPPGPRFPGAHFPAFSCRMGNVPGRRAGKCESGAETAPR